MTFSIAVLGYQIGTLPWQVFCPDTINSASRFKLAKKIDLENTQIATTPLFERLLSRALQLCFKSQSSRNTDKALQAGLGNSPVVERL